MARILFFGRLQDMVDTHEKHFLLPGKVQTTEDLRIHLDELWDFGGGLLEDSVRIAVNGQLALSASNITDEDEIAFLPPVGGG